MIHEALHHLSDLLSQQSAISLLLALAAGFLTSLTPCSLASLPLIVGYAGGVSTSRKKAFFYSMLFFAGRVTALTAVGIIAVLAGMLLSPLESVWNIILAFLLVMMALELWGITHILPDRCGANISSKKGATGAYLLGLLGAVMASHCATPALFAILAVVSSGGSIWFGALMLFVFSLGSSILLIIAGTFAGSVKELLNSQRFQRVSKWARIVLGAIVLLLAAVIIYQAF